MCPEIIKLIVWIIRSQQILVLYYFRHLVLQLQYTTSIHVISPLYKHRRHSGHNSSTCFLWKTDELQTVGIIWTPSFLTTTYLFLIRDWEFLFQREILTIPVRSIDTAPRTCNSTTRPLAMWKRSLWSCSRKFTCKCKLTNLTCKYHTRSIGWNQVIFKPAF